MSHPNKIKQRKNRKEKHSEEELSILEIADRGLAKQLKKEKENGWQYIHGNVDVFDRTPFEAVRSSNGK